MNKVTTVVVGGLVLTTVLSACGVRPSGVISGAAAPVGPSVEADRVLYFVAAGEPVMVQRTDASAPDADVVAILGQGPANEEQARGLSSEVPASFAPATITLVPSGLDVERAGDVAALSPAAVAQIVCTLLVRHRIDGKTVTLRGGGHVLEGRSCGT